MENQTTIATIDTATMQNCTTSYNNPCWILRTDENKFIGVLRSKPFDTLAERMQEAVYSFYDNDEVKLTAITELSDQIHELKVYVPTDIEDGYVETVELTPAWEY